MVDFNFNLIFWRDFSKFCNIVWVMIPVRQIHRYLLTYFKLNKSNMKPNIFVKFCSDFQHGILPIAPFQKIPESEVFHLNAVFSLNPE